MTPAYKNCHCSHAGMYLDRMMMPNTIQSVFSSQSQRLLGLSDKVNSPSAFTPHIPMTSFAREEHVPLRSPLNRSFELSSRHSSQDSEESLRALELADGPAPSTSQRYGRSVGAMIYKGHKTKSGISSARSYSVSGFNFQQDLVGIKRLLHENLSY